MAASPLSDKEAIALLLEQVESRNAEIAIRRQAMTRAINMLKSNNCTNESVINVLIKGM